MSPTFAAGYVCFAFLLSTGKVECPSVLSACPLSCWILVDLLRLVGFACKETQGAFQAFPKSTSFSSSCLNNRIGPCMIGNL